MHRFVWLTAAAFLLPLFGAGNPEQGRGIYRSNCAFCHGLTGLGGRGPDLASGRPKPDAEVRRVVRQGIPGSAMPAFKLDNTEMDHLMAHLKTLAGTAPAAQKITGDAVRGKQIYAKAGCAGCHQIGMEGSAYGPDLSRIGGARPVRYLRESIVKPEADVPQRYEGVSVVLADGKRLTGVRANEDTFTVQLRLPSMKYVSFRKDEVKEVIAENKSLMPAYTTMPEKDLDDLVAYLTTLRGAVDVGKKAEEAKGIHD
jgi:cytochrome c oxidase cbb3-type subunit III